MIDGSKKRMFVKSTINQQRASRCWPFCVCVCELVGTSGNFNLTITAKRTCTFRSYETIVRIESTLVLRVVRWYD